MSRHFTFILTLILFALPAVGAPGDYKVIVHASNPIDSIGREKLADIFLKKVTRWDNGKAITPIDQSEKNAVRGQFSKTVLKKEPAAVDGYWQKMIFSGRSTPPTRLNSDAEVLDFVRGNAEAIAYVSDSAPLGAGLKTISVKE